MGTERNPKGREQGVWIAQLGLPTRARNALLRAGIRTLEEASEWSERDLLSLPHFGRASVQSLRAYLGDKIEGQATGGMT